MNELLSKISSYHLFNYLLPGCLFGVLASMLTHRPFTQRSIVLGLFVYYFYGLVISRIGSLVVEPLLRRWKFLKFADYGEFIAACRKDPKIDELSETNNMYRTLCTLIIVLILLQGLMFIEIKFPWLRYGEWPALVTLLLTTLLLSYKKQTAYIAKRVKANLECP